MSLENKVAIVTGAGSGMGKAIAIKFSTLKAKLSLVDINIKTLEETTNICENNGGQTLSIKADLAKDDDVREIVKKTLDTYNKIDILVNCAGVLGGGDIFQPNFMEEYDRVMSVNLRSIAHLTHLTADALVKTKGAIINICSVLSNVVCQNQISYCASKAGLAHFGRSLALDLAPKGVRVNNIMPGPVRTRIYENNNMGDGDETWDYFEKTQPTGRNVGVEEIANLVVFLADDTMKSLTGASVALDGGMQLKGLGFNNIPNRGVPK